MTSLITAIKSMTESILDENKPPLHVGEVMSCWTYMAILTEAARYIEIGMNTTTDKELSESLEDSKKQCMSET